MNWLYLVGGCIAMIAGQVLSITHYSVVIGVILSFVGGLVLGYNAQVLYYKKHYQK